jgi:uncharacterized protein (TIGR03546 family)
MFALLKLLQSIFQTLHSEGTPRQVAAGFALGAALGLTPLMSVHNLVVFFFLCVLNVSFGGGMLGWAFSVPLGFALDPVFDRIGNALLTNPGLRPMWTAWYNAPGVPYTNFNNTVVLGSVITWLVLLVPIYIVARLGVAKYRETLGEKVMRSRFYQVVSASKLYNVYRLFRPE